MDPADRSNPAIAAARSCLLEGQKRLSTLGSRLAVSPFTHASPTVQRAYRSPARRPTLPYGIPSQARPGRSRPSPAALHLALSSSSAPCRLASHMSGQPWIPYTHPSRVGLPRSKASAAATLYSTNSPPDSARSPTGTRPDTLSADVSSRSSVRCSRSTITPVPSDASNREHLRCRRVCRRGERREKGRGKQQLHGRWRGGGARPEGAGAGRVERAPRRAR